VHAWHCLRMHETRMQATSLESNLDRDWRRGRVYTEMCDDNTALVVSPWAPVETQGQPLAARREARQRVMTLVLSLARACGGVDKMPLLPVEMWANIMSGVWAVHFIPRLAFCPQSEVSLSLMGVYVATHAPVHRPSTAGGDGVKSLAQQGMNAHCHTAL
jgi:hypothetical protein